MSTILLRGVQRAMNFIAPRLSSFAPTKNLMCNDMHSICNQEIPKLVSSVHKIVGNNSPILLHPILPVYNSVRGIRLRGVLERRCKHCYYVTRKERLYIMCSKHPRHKQTQFKAKPYKSWIVTWGSQTKRRLW